MVLAGWLRPSAEGGTSVTSHLRLSQKGWGDDQPFWSIFMVVFQMEKQRPGSGLGRGSPTGCLGIRVGLGLGPAVRSPSCPGGWSAEGQSCPGWHVVAVWGSSVCTVPRATQPGGAGGPGICPHKRIWLQAFVHPSGLLTEPSSTRQGWGQPCRTDAAGTWPRSHQTEDVGLVFTPLVISNPPTHHGVHVVAGTRGPHPGA